ncbi:uncharacterized protein LOC124540983 [Vanessa cardui]|uniref:uncharacterized protein LOC124540983 n=1 Tax=Vanessa cardui TaxID=171605 RepID=UPI001F12CB83|nr:uncharacterized protein LOC124540983 [Vanessa cardui]
MFFGEKLLKSENNFSSSDLLQYIGTLIKESKFQQRRGSINTNYGWLKSRNPLDEEDCGLEKYNNTILKLTSQSRAAIAVKLDRLADESNILPSDIMKLFTKLLDEEENIQLLERNVKIVKERGKICKTNPKCDKRRSSLSFIFK